MWVVCSLSWIVLLLYRLKGHQRMTAFHHRHLSLGQLTHLCVFDMRPPADSIMILSFIELATDASDDD